VRDDVARRLFRAIQPLDYRAALNLALGILRADKVETAWSDALSTSQTVLLETFVQRPRFPGTAYRAANWRCVGLTKGRGKLEKHHQAIVPTKAIFLYPLRPDFKEILTR
jgi:hypothetical protein